MNALPETFTPAFMRQLELLKLRARRAFLGSRQGGHASIKRGHGIEFSDYRSYELGDDPRHIDWGVYGRSDRLYVKRFQEEQNLSVLVIIDPTVSMMIPAGENKWEFARDLALSITYVALMQQDSVTLSVPGSFLSPTYTGGRAFSRACSDLGKTKVSARGNFVRGVQEAVSRVRFPGAAIFISDFLMPFEEVQATMRILRAKNLDITAVQVLSPSDIEPLVGLEHAIAEDSETGETVSISLSSSQREEYQALLTSHNDKVRDLLHESHIPFSQARSDEKLPGFIINNLVKTGLLA